MAQKIRQITVGNINGEPGWIFEYTDGSTLACHLPPPTAKAFADELLRVVQGMTAPDVQVDHLAVGESVQVKLQGGADERWRDN